MSCCRWRRRRCWRRRSSPSRPAWKEFIFAYVFLSKEKLFTLSVGLAQMIIGDVLPWGELMAAALLMAVPVLILYSAGPALYGRRTDRGRGQGVGAARQFYAKRQVTKERGDEADRPGLHNPGLSVFCIWDKRPLEPAAPIPPRRTLAPPAADSTRRSIARMTPRAIDRSPYITYWAARPARADARRHRATHTEC